MKTTTLMSMLLLMQTEAIADVDLSFLNVPDGFEVSLYHENIDGARSLSVSPSGVVYVGSRGDRVYALVDSDNDGYAETKHAIAKGLNAPNGVAFKDGDLYVGEIDRIIRFNDIESRFGDNLDFEVINDSDYPNKRHHGNKYIAFGPDDKLYVPVGAPCNICDSDDKIFNTITRINADGSGFEIVQEGVRNTVGFAWHPQTNELWFTDNGRDRLGDDVPADELNRATTDNGDFGYPYCHQGDLLDPEFGQDKDCADYTPPAQKLNPHAGALGMSFFQGGNFPEQYQKDIFIAEHGSWNRTVPIGYQVSIVTLDDNGEAINYQPFLDGFRDNKANRTYGRPVDVAWLPDGSMLVSDDFANRIYRLEYTQ